MAKQIILSLTTLLLIIIISGCRTVAYTGRSQFIITSEADELEASKKAWKGVLSTETVSKNKAYLETVQRVGRNIASVANRPNYKWEFKVFKSYEANAFCLPGGKIAVYTGLFRFLDNEAELAAIMGHEVGHVIARHVGERMSQEKIADYGSTIVSFVVDGFGGTIASSAFGLGAQYGAILPYERKHEYEADHIGIILMAKAGYNPHAAITFWEKFSEVTQSNGLQELFSTHPMSSKRIDELRSYLPEAMREYKKAKTKRNYGKIYNKKL